MSDVETFGKSCVHCLATATGETVLRPLGHALHTDRPNVMLHFDCCFMMEGVGGIKYVLVLKDDSSGYVWLVPETEAIGETTSKALVSWFDLFGVVRTWVSDRGSHFKNEVVSSLREQTGGSHHFTLAYFPWSNGTVEVVCRELLRATRALISEFQLPHKCWPDVIPVVHSELNFTPLERLDKRCGLTVFTGLPQDITLQSLKAKVEETPLALHEMHGDVATRSSDKRRKEVQRHNARTNVRAANFSKGDFVLRGIFRKENGVKLAVKWRGL